MLSRVIKNLFKIPIVIIRETISITEVRHICLEQMDYDSYWNKRNVSTILPRYKIFADLINRKSKVLDIECGDGTCLWYLKAEKDIEGEGLDISREAVTRCVKKGIRVNIADVSSSTFKIDKKYDYIIISEVLEHIAYLEDLMRKVKGHFNKLVLVSIPNIGYYKHRIRMMFGRFPIKWAFHPAEHLRFWTVKDFIWWAKEIGFEVIDIRPYNGVPFVYKLMPNLFCHQIVFFLKNIQSEPDK
ncbi:hypothetical protein ES705_02546 [subsurface metagenome]